MTAGYLFPHVGALQIGLDARATFANDKYMQTSFSIGEDNGREADFRSMKRKAVSRTLRWAYLPFAATCDFANNWLVTGRIGVKRLAGDAVDSPIVIERGDKLRLFRESAAAIVFD